jgi:two-component system OmpR family sensor kinase
MYLIKEEKHTLIQFLLLYLGSSFILFAIIAYLFYQNESRFFYDKTRSSLEMSASKLSSKIIYAHMSREAFSLEDELKVHRDKIGFYDKNNSAIVTAIREHIDFSKHTYQKDNKMILVDKSTFGHLGVESIVIERDGVEDFVAKLEKNIILMLLLIYFFLSIIGYFLAKLFLKPIQLKRIQLDNFIKDSTHELNTPISALILSVNSPRLTSPKNLERIRLSASRVSAIHKDLTYLMLDKHKQSTVSKELLLNDIVKEELTYLILLAEKKKIELEVQYLDKIYFKIDKESFVRLIHNLISNAIKYNTIGGKIEIVLKEQEIRIKDTGIGIAKEHQKGIYERFYRATNQVGGFGLGLNIVYKVCQEYKIKIDFESEVNEGTAFWLRF